MVHLMARRPSQPEERTVYRFMSLPAARKWVWRLVVICAGVNATYIIFPHSITLGNKNPDLYVSDPCMDSASCRYPTTAAILCLIHPKEAPRGPRRGRVAATAAMAMVAN